MVTVQILVIYNIIHLIIGTSNSLTNNKRMSFDFGMNNPGSGNDVKWDDLPKVPTLVASGSLISSLWGGNDAAASSLRERLTKHHAKTTPKNPHAEVSINRIANDSSITKDLTSQTSKQYTAKSTYFSSVKAKMISIRYDCPPAQNLCDNIDSGCPGDQNCAMNSDCTSTICHDGESLQTFNPKPREDIESQPRHNCPLHQNLCLLHSAKHVCPQKQDCAMNKDCTSFVCVDINSVPDVTPRLGRVKNKVASNPEFISSIFTNETDFREDCPLYKNLCLYLLNSCAHDQRCVMDSKCVNSLCVNANKNKLSPIAAAISKRATSNNRVEESSKTFKDDCPSDRNLCKHFPKCPPNLTCAMNPDCTKKVCVPLKRPIPPSTTPVTSKSTIENSQTTHRNTTTHQNITVDENEATDTEDNITSVFRKDCPESKDLCLKYPSACSHGEQCIMGVNCSRMYCVGNSSNPPPATPETINVKGIYCPRNKFYPCINGNCSDDDFSCDCSVGWDGHKCDKPCTLQCVHGTCWAKSNGQYTRPEDITEEDMMCTCETGWYKRLCDERIPDLVGDAEQRTLHIGVSFGCTLLVVIAISIIALFLLWRKRVIIVMKFVYFFKLEEDNDGRLYDAYISMGTSSKGLTFVRDELCPMLEQLGFKLYVQARDQILGKAMNESIISAMEQSRRTLLIVTSDYLRNNWSTFECQIAQIETLKLHQRIVPIILEDITEERPRMSKSLKHILDSMKCLTHPAAKTTDSSSLSPKQVEAKRQRNENKFWKRLELTMPKKKAKTTSTSTNERESEISDIFNSISSNSESEIPGIFQDTVTGNVEPINITFTNIYSIV